MLVQPGGAEQDLVEQLKHLRGGRLARLMRRIQKIDRDKDAFARQSSMIVQLFRSNGVDIEAGDIIEIRKETWDIFPIGSKANIRSRALGSYEVTADGRLEKVD